MSGLIIDNFAGGGGASTGIEAALGRPVDIAINHDPEAVAMHVANHPATRHFCQSIMAVDPLEATGGAPVALAWFSPDCKHHTGMVGHPATRPLSTIVGRGTTQRLVETTMVPAEALPPELMDKAVRIAAFLIKYYGAAAHGQAVDDPLHAATAKARFAVVTVTIDSATFVLIDIGMRMLTPRELARAQGFPDSYILAAPGPGGKPLTKTAQIRMIGNSVCPAMSEALVSANAVELTVRAAA